MDFIWDPQKATANFWKHGISLEEAIAVFHDPLSLTAFDPDHLDQEDRFVTMRRDTAGRLLVVVHTDRGETIRIIRFCLKRLPLARERAALASGKDGEAARFADLAMEPDAARGQMSRSKPGTEFSDRA